MNILIYKGEFIYNALNEFMFRLGEELSKEYDVWYLDISNKVTYDDIVDFLTKHEIKLILNPNAIGFNVSDKELNNVYDRLNIHYWTYLVDHPMFIINRILDGPKLHKIFCVDRKHCLFLKTFLDIEAEFMPMGGIECTTDYAKEYDITFIGNCSHPNHALSTHVNNLNTETAKKINECLTVLTNSNYSIDEVVTYVFREHPIAYNFFMFYSVMNNMELYVRSIKRHYVLKALNDAGIKVHVFGEIEDKTLTNLIVHPKISYMESIEIMKKSKVSINVLPLYRDGINDRLCNSMLNKCMSITENNLYINKIPHIAKFNVNNGLQNMVKMAKEFIITPNERIINNAYNYAKQNLTWEVRCEIFRKHIKEIH
jgi:hypothetical protein